MKIVGPDDAPVDGNTPTRAAQVLRFNGITKLDLPADAVLNGALAQGLKTVVVLGYNADGTEYFASSMADGADVVWLLERCKRQLLGGEPLYGY